MASAGVSKTSGVGSNPTSAAALIEEPSRGKAVFTNPQR